MDVTVLLIIIAVAVWIVAGICIWGASAIARIVGGILGFLGNGIAVVFHLGKKS